jgi:predicted nucleotidyltransferase
MSKKEYETSKKEYDEEVEYINSYIGEFASKMKEGKAVEALGFLAEFAGMKPHEFKQQLIQNLAPEVDRRRALSPDQLQAEGLQEENKYLMQKREEEKTQFEQQQAYKELEQQIGQLTQSHGISEEEFDQGYAELAETNLKDQLNPELIVNYLRHKTAFTQADSIINEIAPSLSSNDMVINSVEKLIFDNPEMSKDQIGEMVSEVYGKEHTKASKAVSKKIQSKSIEQPVRTLADLEDIVDFDDI